MNVPASIEHSTPMAARRLSLCADDFGQSPAINAGILSLLGRGRLQATSVLAHGPAWADGAARLKVLLTNTDLQVDIGLHLNLTHPFARDPLSRPLSHWLLASQLRIASQAEILDRFASQLDMFVTHFGRLPDYLDGHQHVHAFPIVRDAVMALIDLGWQAQSRRPWLRVPERLFGGDAPFKAWVLRVSTRGFGALAEAHGLRTTPAFGGLYSLRPNDGFEGRMKRWLREAPDGTLIMCHPGQTAAAQDPSDPIGPARAIEYAYLSGDAFSADCARHGVQLVRHASLLAD